MLASTMKLCRRFKFHWPIINWLVCSFFDENLFIVASIFNLRPRHSVCGTKLMNRCEATPQSRIWQFDNDVIINDEASPVRQSISLLLLCERGMRRRAQKCLLCRRRPHLGVNGARCQGGKGCVFCRQDEFRERERGRCRRASEREGNSRPASVRRSVWFGSLISA